MTDIYERHRVRMERKKDIVDAKIAAAQKDIGIIIVNTGNGKGWSRELARPAAPLRNGPACKAGSLRPGKRLFCEGKSSSGFGMVRAPGHGIKVAVVQFIKGAMSSSTPSTPASPPRQGPNGRPGH